jgi:KAP family P-loop domain
VVALAALAVPALQDWLNTQSGLSTAARLGGIVPLVASLLAAVGFIFSRTRRALEPVSTVMLTYGQRPDYSEQMGYQHLVLEDIEFVRKRLNRTRPDTRVFVFIDDLDRCLTEKVVAILQAINLVLSASDFFVILGIDTKMVHRAIEAHYAAQDNAPLPPRIAESYLEKIIQLPFYLPQTSVDERGDYVAQLFSQEARDDLDKRRREPQVAVAPSGEGSLNLKWDRSALHEPVPRVLRPVEDTDEELHAFLDHQAYLADNPRELKRLVNTHRFVKIVLQQEGRPVEEKSQRKLVKWLVFCARWPDHIDGVLERAQWQLGQAEGAEEDVIKAYWSTPGPGPSPRPDGMKTFPESDPIQAKDLAADGPLERAARISQMVSVERLAPRRSEAQGNGASVSDHSGEPASVSVDPVS